MLTACAAEEAPPQDRPAERAALAELDTFEVELLTDAEPDLCALAAGLAADDVCSLVCDPDAFAARLVDDGMQIGNCYQFRCALTDEVSVSVGLCLL